MIACIPCFGISDQDSPYGGILSGRQDSIPNPQNRHSNALSVVRWSQQVFDPPGSLVEFAAFPILTPNRNIDTYQYLNVFTDYCNIRAFL